MLRASSGLLWLDYTGHIGAIDIIRRYKELQDITIVDAPNHIGKIGAVSGELRVYYSGLMRLAEEQRSTVRRLIGRNGKNQRNLREGISITLVTKILTGTLSCIPAFDSEFNAGIRYYHGVWPRLSEGRLRVLFEKLSPLSTTLDEVRKDFDYPDMRLVDWAYWFLGAQLTDEQKAGISSGASKR